MCPLTNANRKKRFLAVSKGTNAHERGDDDQNDDQNDDDFFDQKRLYRREKKIGKGERTETPTPTFSSLWEKKGVVVARVVFCVRVVVESDDFDVESSSSSSGLLEWRENSNGGLFVVTPEKSDDERCRRAKYQRHESKLELERQFW